MSDGNGLQDNGGTALPPAREAIVEQAHRIHQELAHERDMLLRDVAQLKSDIAAYKVMVEAMQAQLAQADSRVETAVLQRDQAVGDRAVYETLFVTFNALFRAFNVPHAPIVKDQGALDDEALHLRRQEDALRNYHDAHGDDYPYRRGEI